MTSCFEFDDDDDEKNKEHNAINSLCPKRDDNVLTILEALLMHMGL